MRKIQMIVMLINYGILTSCASARSVSAMDSGATSRVKGVHMFMGVCVDEPNGCSVRWACVSSYFFGMSWKCWVLLCCFMFIYCMVTG